MFCPPESTKRHLLSSSAGQADKMASRRKSPPLQPTTTLRPAPLLQQVHAQVTNWYVEEDLEMAARFGDSDYREEKILQAKPPEDELDLITKEVGDKWKSLLIQLGVPSGKIKSFLQDNSNVSSSACFDGLVYWRDGNKPCKPATWSVLLDAIERGAEQKEYAQELRDKLFSKKDHMDSSIQCHEEVKELRKALKEKEEELKKLKQDSPIGIGNHGRTESRLAEKIEPWCRPIFRGRMSIYELPKLDITRDNTNGIATVQVGPRGAHLASSPGKVLVLVGATGAEKTTLINAMVNYLFGVDLEDDFRFKMIVEEAAKDQSKSVTKCITAYTIPAQEGSPVPYTLTIIDTPGFGDTEGIERDELIVKQVKELFSKKGPGGIDQLHGIGFVVQSTLTRLTHTRRYIFDSILAIFGKDVEKNVFMMLTFADGQRPPVLDAVKAAKISYETAFKFNNTAIYSEKEQDTFDRLLWEMGMKNLQTFFTRLEKMPAISLQLTRQVLDEREHLEAILKGLQDQIQKGFDIKVDLRQTKDVVKKHEADMERYKEFEFTTTVDEPHKVRLQDGKYTMNCLTCNYTCHFPCEIPNTEGIHGCAAMKDENCIVCPGKCHWTQHVIDGYRIERRKRTVKRTVEDLKKKYYDAKNVKSKYESIVGGLERDLEKKGAEVYENIKQVREYVQRLDEIALKPNPHSEVEYIELMIESEKQQKRPDYHTRIVTLTNVKKQAKLLSKVTKGNVERLKSIKGKDEEFWRIFSQDDN